MGLSGSPAHLASLHGTHMSSGWSPALGVDRRPVAILRYGHLFSTECGSHDRSTLWHPYPAGTKLGTSSLSRPVLGTRPPFCSIWLLEVGSAGCARPRCTHARAAKRSLVCRPPAALSSGTGGNHSGACGAVRRKTGQSLIRADPLWLRPASNCRLTPEAERLQPSLAGTVSSGQLTTVANAVTIWGWVPRQ